MKIAAVIVAAGRSSRFNGGNKMLADLNGTPLIRHAASAVAASHVAEVVLVVSPSSNNIIAAAGEGPWRVAINSDAAAGLSGSIRTGIAVLDTSIDGALIVLGDMPFVTAGLMTKLCETFTVNDGAHIVFPVTGDGRQANPVLWPRALFPALIALTGDTGGKAVLAANAGLHAPVAIDDEAAAFDVDTAEDLDRAKRMTWP